MCFAFSSGTSLQRIRLYSALFAFGTQLEALYFFPEFAQLKVFPVTLSVVDFHSSSTRQLRSAHHSIYTCSSPRSSLWLALEIKDIYEHPSPNRPFSWRFLDPSGFAACCYLNLGFVAQILQPARETEIDMVSSVPFRSFILSRGNLSDTQCKYCIKILAPQPRRWRGRANGRNVYETV